jgi:hypothetical protein
VDHVPKHDVLDLGGLDVRALDHSRRSHGAKFGRRDGHQAFAVRADRSPSRRSDYNFGHLSVPSL